jgi:hypothetical protein
MKSRPAPPGRPSWVRSWRFARERWGTRQALWALLVLAVVAFAVPFGSQNPPVYHEAALTVVFALYLGFASAALIVISAVARLAVDRERQR